jgi:hypothetical protein
VFTLLGFISCADIWFRSWFVVAHDTASDMCALCVCLGVDLVSWSCQCVRVPHTAVVLSILMCSGAFQALWSIVRISCTSVPS